MKLIALAIVVAALLISGAILWSSWDRAPTADCAITTNQTSGVIYPDVTAKECLAGGGNWVGVRTP